MIILSTMSREVENDEKDELGRQRYSLNIYSSSIISGEARKRYINVHVLFYIIYLRNS
jgi:hypothetical protein